MVGRHGSLAFVGDVGERDLEHGQAGAAAGGVDGIAVAVVARVALQLEARAARAAVGPVLVADRHDRVAVVPEVPALPACTTKQRRSGRASEEPRTATQCPLTFTPRDGSQKLNEKFKAV